MSIMNNSKKEIEKRANNNLIEANTKLVDENKYLKLDKEVLQKRMDNAINFIDQVLMYHLHDYKQLDEDCNTLIGILRGDK